MLDNIKKMFNTPVTVEKKGRGETIRFHNYRIFKSGKITDYFGNPIQPKVKNGIAYIPVKIDETKRTKVDIEVGRIMYCYLKDDIDILNNSPKIIYKDGDGTNFKLDNLDIEKIEVLKINEKTKTQFIELDEIEDNGKKDEIMENKNPIEELKEFTTEMSELINSDSTKSTEEMLKELNNRASGIVSNDFAKEINTKIENLETTIEQLKNMRDLDSIEYQNKMKEKDTQMQELKVLLDKKEQETAKYINQTQTLLREKATIEKNYILMDKTTFSNMYKTMNKVLDMVDKINR